MDTLDLTEIANRVGTDKGTELGDWGTAHGYTKIYERFLADRRQEPLRLLELGVWKGASLQMWESYLPRAEIIGVEIDSEIVSLPLERARVKFGDAKDPNFIEQVINEFSGAEVDVIVDDASHMLEDQIRSFEFLFPHLSDNGIYFCGGCHWISF